MNYIAEIRAFYDWLQLNQLPADAQALWHLLMHFNNKAARKQGDSWMWPEKFTVANSTITSILSFSRQQLDRMRNVLIQAGRIEYKKGQGSRSGTYRLIPFDANYVTQSVTQTVTQTGHKPDTNPDLCNIFGTYIIGNSNPNNNDNSGDGGGARTREASSQALDAYLADRDLNMDAYFGYTAETKAAAQRIAEGLFTRFAGRPPNEQDVFRVFRATSHNEPVDWENPAEWRIDFPAERVKLLAYAFEAAADAGKPGNWQYIQGVLNTLRERNIETVDEAEQYDVERTCK